MTTQEELTKEIGNIESEAKRLEPKKVKIVKIEIQEVGDKKNKKVVCSVKHPDADDTISISALAYLKDKKVVNSGLWYNLDKEENIQKGSALATFMDKNDVKNLLELIDKEIETEFDSAGYLCFRAY